MYAEHATRLLVGSQLRGHPVAQLLHVVCGLLSEVCFALLLRLLQRFVHLLCSVVGGGR